MQMGEVMSEEQGKAVIVNLSSSPQSLLALPIDAVSSLSARRQMVFDSA